MPDAIQIKNDEGGNSGQAPERRHSQGHYSGGDRQDWNCRRQRIRLRIHGRGSARTFHGRAHDHVQYVHRRRRARGVAPDETTFAYMEGRPFVPRGKEFQDAVDFWRTLPSDPDAKYDDTLTFHARDLAPMVTWGTNPGMVTQVSDRVPDPASFSDPVDREAATRALIYMDLKPGTAMEDISLDRVFIGSCTNSRLEDLRAAAKMIEGKHVAKSLKQALVVPGSRVVKAEAEAEGLDKIFVAAGFEWRDAGCSMCIGMNDDVLLSGERSASTSNRNFEGRQGKGGRTHLVSPVMAAAAAIEGHFVDIRKWNNVDGAE